MVDESQNVAPNAGQGAAPEPSAASQTAGAAAQATTGDEEFLRVQKAQFAPWQGNTHEAIKRAKAYDDLDRQGIGELMQFLSGSPNPQTGKAFTPRELVAFLRESGDDGAANAAQQAGQVATQQGADPEEIAQRAAQAAVEAFKREQATERQTQARDQGFAKEKTTYTEAMKSLGIEDEKRNKYFQRVFDQHVQEVIAENLPPYLSEQEKRSAMSMPATETQLAQAGESFKAFVADLGIKAVSDYATNQKKIPSATLSGGRGGRPGPKHFSEHSKEEQNLIVLGDPAYANVLPD